MADAPLGGEARQFLSRARVGTAVVNALEERDLATADEALEQSLKASHDPLLVWAGLLEALRDRDYTWDEWLAQMEDPTEAESDAVTALVDGYEALAEERWEAAQRAAEQLLAQAPESAAGHLLIGELMEAAGCVAEAIDAYRRADRQTTGDPYAAYKLAELASLLNLFEEAEEAYLRAAERAPEDGLRAWLFHSVGTTLQEAGKHAEAVVWHERAVAAEPNDTILTLAYAAALLDASRYDEAMATAEDLLSRPELEGSGLILRPQVQVALAAACYNLEDYDRAALLCQLALQPQPSIDPETAAEIETQLHRILEKWSTTDKGAIEARLLLGNRMLAMGQVFGARIQAKAAQEIEGEDAQCDLLASRLALAEGNLETALSAADAGLSKVPNEPFLRYQRAMTVCSLDPEDGEVALNRILSAEPGNPLALSDRALVRMGLDRYAEAMVDLQAAFIQSDGQWYPLFVPGKPLYGRPFYADLAREARFTLELVPNHAEARTRLAAIHLLVDQKEEALATIEPVLESPDNLDAWRTAVTIRAAVGDAVGVIEAAKTVLAKDPTDPFCRYWAWQGDAMESPEDRARLLDRLESTLHAEPDWLLGWMLLGQLAADQERGLLAYRHLASELSELSAPCVLLGEALRFLGRFEEAEAALRQALERRQKSPRAWRSLGAVLQAQGQTAEAKWADGWSYYHERRPALALASWEAARTEGWDEEQVEAAKAAGHELQQELLGLAGRLSDRIYPY